MSFERNRSSWQAPEPFLWNLIRSNLALVFYLALAGLGMMAVYWFFSPPAAGDAEAFSAAGEDDALAARIFKAVPAQPVVQRFIQSPGPIRIGIISGHKDHDAGAVCADGLTEEQVNANVAEKVLARLQEKDIRAEILSEFDPRLQNYSASAIISIHADSCDYINELATGFKISGSSFTNSAQLSTCIEQAYSEATGLPYHANTITDDMKGYHAFREIAPGTQAVIIETGFMNLDRELLTGQADVPAEGITNGILCFLESQQTQVSSN